MFRRLLVTAVSVLFSTALFATDAPAREALVMGVHPYKPAAELFQRFKPIADQIAKAVGRPVELRVGKTYEDTARMVGTGEVDFCFLGPTLYVQASDAHKVVPLAMIVNNGKPSFHGVIVVKKGSGIASLKDMKGKSIAFGDKNSTMTHVVPLYMLMEQGLHLSDLNKHAFVGSHDNVALGVLRGAFDAAGLMPDVANKYLAQGLEIITKTPDIPEHVFVASPSLDAAVRKNIQEALLALDAPLYRGIKDSVTGLRKFQDKDFDVLRKILATTKKELEK